MGKLTALKVKNAGPGRHADGDGLYLFVRETGSRQYLLRVQVGKIRRDLGLGTAETQGRNKDQQAAAEAIPLLDRRSLTLSEAREKAEAYSRMIKAGVDPADERAKQRIIPTFEKAARSCHDELKRGWKNQKHVDVWLAALVNHAFPEIGAKPVDSIDSLMVRDLLAPIWIEKAETARRVLQRIGTVLDFAHIKGWRASETSLKAVRRGLPRQPLRDNHFEAMPYPAVPAFMAATRAEEPTAGRDALLFTILTAVRSNETRFATWPEIDLTERTWTIPSSRMKMGVRHVVPLSEAAIAILNRRWEARSSDRGLIFYSTRTRPTPEKPAEDRPLSDMTMTKILRDAKIERITVHGFRSSFTDWAAEKAPFPKEVVDRALAHKVPDRVAAAYRRTDYWEKRVALMNLWAAFLAGTGNVVRLAASA